jgi:hypothetical protein
MPLRKVVSGGQTGVDRAALDAARSAGWPIGGWVPRGRAAEDGRIPDVYAGLLETSSPDPAQRTRLNVQDSDATLILAHGALMGGTSLTEATARQLQRPCLCIDLAVVPAAAAAERVRRWLTETGAEVLNVAGPRASEAGSVYADALAVLTAVLAPP